MNKKAIDIVRSNKGVTLITLAVIVIVLIILAAVTINGAVNNNSILDKSSETRFKTDALEIKDRFEKKLSDILLQGGNISDMELLEKLEEYLDGDVNKDILGKLVIIEGELAYLPGLCTPSEAQWFEDIGIRSALTVEVSVTEKIFSKDIEIKTEKIAGYDLVFVLDISGSMTFDKNTRVKRQIDVLNKTMDYVYGLNDGNNNNRIGIATYSTTGSQYVALGNYYNKRQNGEYFYVTGAGGTGSSGGTATIFSYNGIASSISVSGGTYTQRGLQVAYEMLSKANRTEEKYKNNVPVIMLITDGEPTYYNTNYQQPPASYSGGNGSGTDVTSAYYTVLTGSHIKRRLIEMDENAKIFTIGTDLDPNTDNGKMAQLLLDPSETNMANAARNENCTKCIGGYLACTQCKVKGSNNKPGDGVCATCGGAGTTGSGSSIAGCTKCEVKGSGTKNKNIVKGNGKCATCGGDGITATECTTCKGGYATQLWTRLMSGAHPWEAYADASKTGNFTVDGLFDTVKSQLETIKGGDYEKKFTSDGTYTSSTTVDSEDGEIEFKLDRTEKIKMTLEVKHVQYEVGQDGRQLRDEKGKPKYTVIRALESIPYTYTYDQVNNGQAENLKIQNERLVWSIRKEYGKNSKGMLYELKRKFLKETGKTEQDLLKANQGVEITDVLIEYWVIPKI